jgi:two-component system sensor histidine kinase PilS (NtrC family)
VLAQYQGLPHLLLAGVYLLSTALAVAVAYRDARHASAQLTTSVLVDVLVMTLLIHVGSGLGSGFGSLLLVTLAGAGLVGEGRLVLFYAAMATLAVLFEQSYRPCRTISTPPPFFTPGFSCIGFLRSPFRRACWLDG